MAAGNPIVEKIITAVQLEAQRMGHLLTPRGRKLLRRELGAEFTKPDADDSVESDEESVQAIARRLLQYAEKQDAFRTKTRVCVVVVQIVAHKLRADREAPAVWPFC